MNTFSWIGKIFIFIGLTIACVGVLILLGGKIPWLGRLPGDFYYRGKHFTFYFPLTTSIIISIILTLIFTFISRK